jgi:tripartite-type tricarboxylate transporter receptor subunit TctC
LGYPAFEIAGWAGFLVPAGTSPHIIARLNKELTAAMQQRDFLDWVAGNGSEVLPGTPEEFASYMRTELARWSKIIKDAKVETQ